MKKITVVIKGMKPGLLMHSNKGMLDPDAEKPAKGIPTKADAEKVAYRSENGTLFIPTAAIYGTMMNAAKTWIKQGSKLKTLIGSGALGVEPAEEIPILDLKGKPVKDYDLNIRVINNFRAGRLPVGCPQIKEWMARFEMHFNPAIFLNTPQTVKVVLEKAGLYVGILAWRPQHLGTFGRFTVEEWEVEDE